MKGVICVGGMGTRLDPMTRVINKHLLPVGPYPMVYYPLQTLVEAGIRDIILVTGGNNAGMFLELLGTGKEFGLAHLHYVYQQSALGVADALRLAEDFVDEDRCVVMLGDNIIDGSIRPYVEEFERQPAGAKVLLKHVDEPRRFGVAELAADGKLLRIVEKPKKYIGNYAQTGIYMYDAEVWDLIRTLKLSERGQYEITDLNNRYLERGLLTYDILECNWSDAGTPESLFRATLLVREHNIVDANPNMPKLAEED